MQPKAKKALRVTANVFGWIFLVLALLMTIMAFAAQASSTGIPKIGKVCFLTVQSDSMKGEGGFKKGDMIICKTLSEEEQMHLSLGDVITFETDKILQDSDGNRMKAFNTHKIVEVRSDVSGDPTYVTQGINPEMSQYADGEIRHTEALALWTGKKIVGIGSVIDFLQSQLGFFLCVVLPLGVFFLYELFVMINTVMKIKNKGKRQITAEDEELIKQRAVEEYLRQQGLTPTTATPTATATDETATKETEPSDNGESVK